jgi:hypothetical protein
MPNECNKNNAQEMFCMIHKLDIVNNINKDANVIKQIVFGSHKFIHAEYALYKDTVDHDTIQRIGDQQMTSSHVVVHK